MQSKDRCEKLAAEMRVKHGIDRSPENLVPMIHLMNKHSIDVHAALDHSSQSAGDHGIDGWHFDERSGELFIYQSKLSSSKGLALAGFSGLDSARSWLEKVIVRGEVEKVPDNPCLYNLFIRLSQIKDQIKKLNFILLSLFDQNELEDAPDFNEFIRVLQKSELMPAITATGGKLNVSAECFNLDSSIPTAPTRYPVKRFMEARVELRKNACLDLSYVSLVSLVELYRRKGDSLFEKNVRLSLLQTKETKDRLVHPMEHTFNAICDGELSPAIFPFYHCGITIRAATNQPEADMICLEAPSIINGCQSITIAASYFARLEKEGKAERIQRFKDIQVVAKVVTGTTDDELKEITNSNNRQIPIENWQLFSNDKVQIEVELALKSVGVFYERQKGKFETMRSTETAKLFPFTSNTSIDVEELGQIIALSRGQIQWAAKRSEIFLNKKNHDSVFDANIPRYTRDAIFVSNLFKALRRGLDRYLSIPTYADETSAKIFRKPIVKNHLYYAGLLFFYQSEKKSEVRYNYSEYLNKIANQTLVAECETFFQKVVSKTKQWYLTESKQLEHDVSSKKLAQFLSELCIDIGTDPENGAVPFGPRSIDWDALAKEYDSP